MHVTNLEVLVVVYSILYLSNLHTKEHKRLSALSETRVGKNTKICLGYDARYFATFTR